MSILPLANANAEVNLENDPSKNVVIQPDADNGSYLFPRGGGAPRTSRATVWYINGALNGYKSSTILPPGGASGIVATQFRTNVVGSQLDTVATLSGTSSAKWLGGNPFNASSISLTDTLWANSLGVTTVNVGSGLGAGISVVGSTITYSNTTSSTWQNVHNYSGWQFSGLLLNVNQSATASYRFGSTTFIEVVN